MITKGFVTHIASKKVLILVCIIFVCTCCSAQLCTGSLGDPVVNITFGAGPNPGGPLAITTTNYTYTADSCPSDGSYTVTHSSGGCYADTWHTLTHDHTGDPNGYYMLINASYPPGIFYVDTVKELCGSTTYQFAAWILNLLKPNTSVCGATGIMPNITFSIEKLNGSVIQSFSTGDIAPTDSSLWTQYGFYFTTQPNLTEVVIKMTNNAPGGCGNDLAMDDITFRACGPQVNINIADNNNNRINKCVGATSQTVLLNSMISSGYDAPAYQWQRSIDTGRTWLDIPNENATTLNVALDNTFTPGTYLYRLTLGEAQNIGSPNCRVISNVDTVVLGLVPKLAITSNSPLCAGDTLVISATGGARYNWAGPNNFSSTNDSVVIAQTSASNKGEYYVTAVSLQGCSAKDSTAVLVNTVIANAGKDTTICEGSTVQLLASGGTTYTWSPTSTLSSPNIPNPLAAPTGTTNYTVKVGEGGCFDTAMVTVNVVKKLAVSSNSPVCAGGIIILAASNGNTYGWSGPDAFAATGDTVKIINASLANAGVYYVRDSTNKRCSNIDSVIVAIPNPVAHAGKDTAICKGASVQLNGSGDGSFLWQPPNGLSATNIPNPIASPTVTTTYTLTVTQNGCTASDSVIVTVLNKIQASNNSPICSGDTLILKADGCNVCAWAGPAGFAAVGTALHITGAAITNEGMYFVSDTADKACIDTASTNVVIKEAFANAGNDTTVCEGASIQLNGSGNGTFMWQPPIGLSSTSIPNPVLTATQTTPYILTVEDSGCIRTDTVAITVDHPAVVNAGPDKVIIQGQSVVLEGSISDSGVSYFWSPDLYMDNPHSLTPVVNPPSDIMYTLNIASGNVCGVSSDSVFVKVYDKVVIPNAFSPNGDGINDTWQIQALAAYTNADVSIFSRWGQMVFHSIGYSPPWDGTYNGKPLPLATYYYIIKPAAAMPVLSGWVVIVK